MRYRVYSFGAATRHLLMIDAEDASSAARRFVDGFGRAPPFEVVVVMAEGSSMATRYAVRDLRRRDSGGAGDPRRDPSSTAASRRGRPVSAEEQRHFATLGLEGPVTPAQVRRRYRELAGLYHPDKVVHLGPKLRQAAEDEMKAINQAFTYFRDRYGF